MRAPRSVALASTVTLGVAASCAQPEPPRVAIVTQLTAPRALLDRASTLEVRVLEGQVGCDASTGVLDFPSGEASARELLRAELGSDGCADGARFCGDVAVEKSNVERVFAATANDGAGRPVAVGCAVAKVDRDALPIAIRMARYLEAAVCEDGVVQPTEQCEPTGPGGGVLCDTSCLSTEVLLSTGSAQNHTSTGTTGDKYDPFFLWPAGAGAGGRFLAFFTDKATGATNNTDVGLRVMGADLAPLTTPPALASGSIFLSNGTTFPSEAAPLRQSMPQAAVFGNRTWVVFQDDDSPGTFGLDIHARSLDDVLQSEQRGAPLTLNGASATPTGEPGIQSAPSVAAGKSRLFVAWEDGSAGRIVGRTLSPPATLGSQNELSTGNANTLPSVAATGAGFVTVWRGGTGIRLRALNEDGTPQGADTAVSDGGTGFGRARVAALADGRFAVVWTAGGNVFAQRFDAKGARIGGDQTVAINDAGGRADQVSIAASSSAGGAYVVAWLDTETGHVHARFLDGTGGFLYNHVTGRATSFQASRVDGRKRETPTVAIGGAEPAVAIGWADQSGSRSGIVVRRFPLPEQ